MALRKICGIETEYGIIHNGANQLNPIAASSVLISSYLYSISNKIGPQWNFEGETPGLDARDMVPITSLAPEVETQLVNAVLTNGARYYVDHAHPEFSSPECSNAFSVLLYDKAGEEILRRSMEATAGNLEGGEEIIIYKNNSDGKGNSYGCHENYLMDRELPFGQIVMGITPHFITRQIYTGAGKLGTEVLDPEFENITFQLSQRADFIEEEVGLETTLKRPIINTRDEPHAYAKQYRRLHVIIGDANMSQTATFLKLGTTAILLSMLEDNFLDTKFVFVDPVYAVHQVSNDLSLSAPLKLINSKTATALEIQWELFDQSRNYAESEGLEAVDEEVGKKVLKIWEEVLTSLESDLFSLADRVDWVAKYRLVSAYREKHNLSWNDARLYAMDLQYHDLRSTHSLAERMGLVELLDSSEVQSAITEPPEDTRAYFRGECLKRYGENIIAVNWDSLVFSLGEETLKRVPMMEPALGTKENVKKLLDSCPTAAELLEKIDS